MPGHSQYNGYAVRRLCQRDKETHDKANTCDEGVVVVHHKRSDATPLKRRSVASTIGVAHVNEIDCEGDMIHGQIIATPL